MIIFEPELEDEVTFYGSKVINTLNEFKQKADVIIANRISSDLHDVIGIVYTRDLFLEN